MTRIPHTEDPIEVRQAFQQLVLQTDVITTGVSGYLLVAAGVNVKPVWQIVSAAVDHGAVGGLGDDDHAIYLLAGGTRNLTGNLAVDALVTIDGRDISVDGAILDTLAGTSKKVAVDSGATPDYLGAALNDGALRTSTGLSYADGGNFITLTTNDGEIVHDNLSGYAANEHIDWTGATDAFLTDNTGVFRPGVTDATAFSIEGNTNPFTTSGVICYTAQFRRTMNCGTGNTSEMIGFLTEVIMAHTNAKLTDNEAARAFYAYVNNSGTITNETAVNYNYRVHGAHCLLGDTGTHATTGTGENRNYWYGSRSEMILSPTFTNTGGGRSRYYVRGVSAEISNTPTLSSGLLTAWLYGIYISVTGTTVGSSLAMGLHIATVTGCDSNFAVYDSSGATWALYTDNQKFRMGAAIDASIYYDGTNFCINPKEVGTGYLDVKGGIVGVTGKFVLGATDTTGIWIDGTTNPFTTSGTACYTAKFTREINVGTGEIDNTEIVYSHVELTHTNAKLVSNALLRSHLPQIDFTGTISNETASDYSYSIYGVQELLGDTGTYTTTSTGNIYPNWYGNRVTATLTPTFTDSGGASSAAYSVFGFTVRISCTPTLSSGDLLQYLYGFHIRVDGNNVGTSVAYGVYIYSVSGCDTNWGIYDISGANWALKTDNQKILIGEEFDASIYYDGSNLVLDPKEVGTGYLDVKGGITADGTIAGTTITGVNVTSGVDPGHTHGGAAGGGWSPTAVTVNISAAQTIATGTDTLVQFDQEEHDPGSCFNTGTYQYTVPSTGYYLITFSVRILDVTSGKILTAWTRKGIDDADRLSYSITRPGATGAATVDCSKVVYLTATEYVELMIYQDCVGNKTLSDYDPATFMSIIRLA